MVRKLEFDNRGLMSSEYDIEGFAERTVTPIGMSGKVDISMRYIGRRFYVIITKTKAISKMRGERNNVPHSYGRKNIRIRMKFTGANISEKLVSMEGR